MSKKPRDHDSNGRAASIPKSDCKDTLHDLQVELVKLQRHFIKCDDKILIILEGKDAAGKDGTIKRIVQHLSPRETRIVALGSPPPRRNHPRALLEARPVLMRATNNKKRTRRINVRTTQTSHLRRRQEVDMTISSVSQGNPRDLPQALRTAQEAIGLPEIQEILRRLSEYQLGIFMPHMHDERSGDFQALPDEVVQVESGLEVSFQSRRELEKQTDQFLSVGWVWRAGAATPVAVCKMASGEGTADQEFSSRHETGQAVR